MIICIFGFFLGLYVYDWYGGLAQGTSFLFSFYSIIAAFL